MTGRGVVAVALAVLLATAGCTGGLVGEEAADDGAETPVDVRADGGELAEGVDPNRIYERVHELRGVNGSREAPVALEVRGTPGPQGPLSMEVTAFQALWGLDPHDMGRTTVAGWARPGQVRVFAGVVETPTQQRRTIAHEYLHLVQFREGHGQLAADNVDAVDSNQRRVRWMVVEGAAEWFDGQYMAEYHGVTHDRSWRTVREGRSAFGRYLIAVYYFGAKYVDDRIDDPANLDRIYEHPPQTTEQILHGYEPGEEPPLPVDVTARTDGTDWSETETATKGELFVRLVLESELSVERAREAAAGWGGDTATTFWISSEDRHGYAWTLRWDSASEADEFAAAMGDYLDARGNRTDAGWADGETAFRLVRPDDETVVVVAGDGGFVDRATVTGADGEYTVAVGNESEGTAGSTRAPSRRDRGTQAVTTVTAPSNSRMTC